jgi:hypothetical protein
MEKKRKEKNIERRQRVKRKVEKRKAVKGERGKEFREDCIG